MHSYNNGYTIRRDWPGYLWVVMYGTFANLTCAACVSEPSFRSTSPVQVALPLLPPPPWSARASDQDWARARAGESRCCCRRTPRAASSCTAPPTRALCRCAPQGGQKTHTLTHQKHTYMQCPRGCFILAGTRFTPAVAMNYPVLPGFLLGRNTVRAQGCHIHTRVCCAPTASSGSVVCGMHCVSSVLAGVLLQRYSSYTIRRTQKNPESTTSSSTS